MSEAEIPNSYKCFSTSTTQPPSTSLFFSFAVTLPCSCQRVSVERPASSSICQQSEPASRCPSGCQDFFHHRTQAVGRPDTLGQNCMAAGHDTSPELRSERSHIGQARQSSKQTCAVLRAKGTHDVSSTHHKLMLPLKIPGIKTWALDGLEGTSTCHATLDLDWGFTGFPQRWQGSDCGATEQITS